jgi:S-adenosylmethionine hydrolase
MIILFTDYGLQGPYTGQVQAVLCQRAASAGIVNLMADAPRHNPRAAAYLLAALIADFPPQTVFFAVVDPGVGSFTDEPVVLKIDGRWFVGPDNGLFDIVARRGREMEAWRITWRPEALSHTFHGRDIYAPVCAMIANQHMPPGEVFSWTDRHGWPDDLNEIIYIDHFGNAMTGLRATLLPRSTLITLNGEAIVNARTFSEVKPGSLFWFENSSGLIEIAVNQGNAAQKLGIRIGNRLSF